MSELPLCECGCGEQVAKKGNRFINGHNHRGKSHTSEHCAKISETSLKLYRDDPTLSQRQSEVMLKKYRDDSMRGQRQSERLKESEAAKASQGRQRGGDDIVNHHFIYDHSDLHLNIIEMTRSDHTRLHRLLQKLGYVIPHINRRK